MGLRRLGNRSWLLGDERFDGRRHLLRGAREHRHRRRNRGLGNRGLRCWHFRRCDGCELLRRRRRHRSSDLNDFGRRRRGDLSNLGLRSRSRNRSCLRHHRVGFAKRESDRLSRVNSGGSDAHEGGYLVRGLGGLGELHPVMNTGVKLVCRNVLSGDGLRLGPVAGQRVRKGKVLPNGRIRALSAGRGLEDRDRLIRLTGKSQRKTVIRSVERRAASLEESNRFVLLAERRFDERKLEDHARLVRVKRQRILERRFSRSKSAAGEIRVAEQSPETRIVRILRNGAFGEVDCLGDFVRIERGHRTGGESDILIRCPAPEMGLGLRRCAAGEHRSERDCRHGGAEAERSRHDCYPLRFAFSAIASSSGMRSSSWSSASVTNCCADRPPTAQASRSFR